MSSATRGSPADGEFGTIDTNTGHVQLGDGVADVVTAVETIEHVENPRAFARELTRLCRPGQWVVVTTPNQLSLLSKLTLVLRNEFNAFRASSYPAHLTALLEVDLRRIASECGWTDVTIRYTGEGRIPGTSRHYPGWLSRLFPRALSDNIALAARTSSGAHDTMNDLTTGSLTGHLLKTTSFMLVSMVFQTLYVLIDLYWVGRLGTDAVAAVGVSTNLMFFVLAATQMLGVGTTTLVAHATGQRDQARASLIFNQAQGLSVAVGVLFLVVVLAIRVPYANLLGADAVTAKMAADYLAVVRAGDGAPVRVHRHGRGLARHRQLQARDGRADRHRDP